MDRTNYITGPHGGIWHPDVWALLPFVVQTMDMAHDNPEVKPFAEQLSAVINPLLEGVQQEDDINLHMDILQVRVDAGIVEQWRLDGFRRKQRDKQRTEFWRNMVEEGRIDEYDAYLLTRQIIDGRAKAVCNFCGEGYWREYIQPGGGSESSGVPMIFWINNVPEDWGKQGPGHFQYDSICGGICWDCGIDGPPAGPPRPENLKKS